MRKTRTREEILDEIKDKAIYTAHDYIETCMFLIKMSDKLDEFEDEEELEEFRKNWRTFAKQLKIMQEETGFTKDECLDLIKEAYKNNGNRW